MTKFKRIAAGSLALVVCLITIRCMNSYRATTVPTKVSETEVTKNFDFSQLLIDHRGRNMPLCFRNILKGKWPAVQNWQGPAGAAYLADELGIDRILELDGDIPEQRTPPLIRTRLGDYVRWMQEHPDRESVEAYKSRTGLLPDLAEWKEFWQLSDQVESDVGYLQLFAQQALGLSVFEAYLWWGPAGARTGLHADLDPFNVLCQVVGKQQVTLWPPGQRHLLYPGPKYDRGAELSEVDVWDPEAHDNYPLFSRADNVSITLYPGDILYIPNGWWHTTEILEHSISITANMFTRWDKMVEIPSAILRWLHEQGLWKRGHCTCHEQGKVIEGFPD